MGCLHSLLVDELCRQILEEDAFRIIEIERSERKSLNKHGQVVDLALYVGMCVCRAIIYEPLI